MALIPGTLVKSTPKIRYSSALRSNDLGSPRSLIVRLLCSLRRLKLCCSGRVKFTHMICEFAIQFRNQLLVVAEGGKRLAESKKMFGTIITFKRLCDRVFAVLHSAMAKPCQGKGIPFTGQNRVDNLQPLTPVISLRTRWICRFIWSSTFCRM